MASNDKDIFNNMLGFLLAPIVRYCLRRGIKLNELVQMVKQQFVEQASMQLQSNGLKESDSRISIMTGVHRKDVVKLKDASTFHKSSSADVATRVISLWQTDKRFTTKSKNPKTLTCEGESSEFASLVRKVSREINAYTVLFELERIGSVRRTAKGLKLIKKTYIPVGDWREGAQFLSTDIDDIIGAVEDNLFGTHDTPNLHIKTQYDSIPAVHEEKIKTWLLKEGSQFHKKMRDYLSQFDVDFQRDHERQDLLRISIGSFSRIDATTGDKFHENR